MRCLDFETAGTAEWLGIGYAGGAVGEMVADLNRAGKRHAVITGVVEGGDPQVAAEIEDWCRAAQVRRRLRYTNLAQIGRPYPGMMDLYIDETNLYHRMGLYTKQFDWEKMWAIADDVTDEDAIAAKAADIHDTFDIIGDYDESSIHEMARYVVAFEQWVKDEELGLGQGRRARLHAHPRVLDAHQARHRLRRGRRHQGGHGHEHHEDYQRCLPALGVLHLRFQR